MKTFSSVVVTGIFCLISLSTLGSAVPNHAVILLYHHVADDTPVLTSISPEKFAEQLGYLSENGFTVMALDKVVRSLANKQALPDKVVSITFDDSYQSVYSTAFPLLKQYRYPFTIFVSTDAIDQGFNYQTSWDQLRIMARDGATIANHGASHGHLLQRLPGEAAEQWRQRVIIDIENAERRIEREVGHNTKLFAYPYGEYNVDLEGILDELGYIGLGQQSGAVGEGSNVLALPRFPFSGKYTGLDDFSLKLMTLPLPVTVAARTNPLDYSQDRPPVVLMLPEDSMLGDHIECFASHQGKLERMKLDSGQLQFTPKESIPVGRSRYNCTAPHSTGRYYWFSQPWIRLGKDGQWPAD